MDNTIRSWNAGAEVLYGWKAHEVIGRNCWKLLCSRSSLSLEDIKAVLLVDGSWDGELLETTCDGKAVTVLTRWSLSRDHRGQPIAILASNNDISDARLAEEALHRSEVDLMHISRITRWASLRPRLPMKLTSRWQPLLPMPKLPGAGLAAQSQT
jgi:PAS domain S-box-containing protein